MFDLDLIKGLLYSDRLDVGMLFGSKFPEDHPGSSTVAVDLRQPF
jgi:hypothetical protein